MIRLNGRFWDIAAKATLMVVWAGVGALASHEIRLTRIEETRFTDADGLRLHKALEEECHRGPDWLRVGMSDLKKALERVDDRLQRLEARR